MLLIMDAYQPGAYWYSKIQDFRKCQTYFQERHILGNKVEEKNGDLEFGTAMHLGINEVLTGNDGETTFKLYWDSVKDAGLEYGRFNHEQLEEMGLKLLARFIRLHAKHFKPFKMEERIHHKIGPYNFEGTPDFIGEYKDVRSVLDFKTSGYRYDKLKIRCDDQMPIYAKLAEEKYGYAVEQRVYVVFVKDAKEPSIQVVIEPLTSNSTNSTIDNVILTCNEIEGRKAFTKNPLSCVQGTRVCPYFESCWGAKNEEGGSDNG